MATVRTSCLIEADDINKASIAVHDDGSITALIFDTGDGSMTLQSYRMSPAEFAAALQALAERVQREAESVGCPDCHGDGCSACAGTGRVLAQYLQTETREAQ